MIGEILTWCGVAIAALATYALYRSAVSTLDSHENRKPVQHATNENEPVLPARSTR